ncbi:MAG: threonine ammonia-lyase [Deltaproteobacteria bacterium]|nr:MAG: threonine ammonia-lyase [Deltaproteobacteria bacterium]
MLTFTQIEAARRRIAGAVSVTPCARSERISRMCGVEAYFKLENLQMTGSFKERGALNRLLTLSETERARGVVAASAGNHAQGLAYHAGRLGIRAAIVMPEGTPLIKVTSTLEYGAEVILRGGNYDEAYAYAVELAAERGATFVHPFDDEEIMAGQGTIGLELLEQNPFLEAIVVPVGGGGLIAGIATAVKETNPKIRIVGVETEALPAMKRSLEAGHVVEVPPATTLADGIAVKRPGEKTFPVIQKYVDEIVTVEEDETAAAILVLLEREKTVVEGAGAVTLAAVQNRHVDLTGKKVCMVLSGGNIDVSFLSRIIERGLVKDGRLVRLTVTIPDRPGALGRLSNLVGDLKANIIQIVHDRAFTHATNLGETDVALTLETRGPEHVEELVAALRAAGYAVTIAS